MWSIDRGIERKREREKERERDRETEPKPTHFPSSRPFAFKVLCLSAQLSLPRPLCRPLFPLSSFCSHLQQQHTEKGQPRLSLSPTHSSFFHPLSSTSHTYTHTRTHTRTRTHTYPLRGSTGSMAGGMAATVDEAEKALPKPPTTARMILLAGGRLSLSLSLCSLFCVVHLSEQAQRR